MDAVRNPFAPGAGSRPPELAGRDAILQDAHTAIQRALLGRPSRSQMLLGLRGVGKTVLLNKIEEMAEAAGHVTSAIEAPEGKALSELLVPRISQALRKLSTSENAKAKAHQALRALRSFTSAFKLSYGDASILGAGPYRSSDVAAALNETHQSLGPRRAQIISKGMIYSPSHGDIAFTVPMFNEYLIRNYVKKSSKG